MHWYNTRRLTLREKRAILYRAKEVCDKWRVNILDCSKSVYRQPIEMSFEDIMAKFKKGCIFNIIHRKNPPENYLEISFSTMEAVDYFLWIELDPKHIEDFTEGLENV